MPKNTMKTVVIIEETIVLCALVTTFILMTWNVDVKVLLIMQLIGGVIAVISLLVGDVIEQSRIDLRIPESIKSRHKLYFILGLGNVGLFLYMITGTTRIANRLENFVLQMIIVITVYSIVLLGIYLYYYYLITTWKDDFEKLKEDIYSLRYRPPGEIIGAAFRVDPSIEKDVSGILQWIVGKNQIHFNVVGIILSGTATLFIFMISINDFSIIYFLAILLFLSFLLIFTYRIIYQIRSGPRVITTEFVASKKVLSDMDLILSQNYKILKSSRLVELFENGRIPESNDFQFRNNDNGIMLSFINLKLITDSNNKNKHMTGTIMLFRPTKTEESSIERIMQQIETSFPVKRRKLDVLLY